MRKRSILPWRSSVDSSFAKTVIVLLGVGSSVLVHMVFILFEGTDRAQEYVSRERLGDNEFIRFHF